MLRTWVRSGLDLLGFRQYLLVRYGRKRCATGIEREVELIRVSLRWNEP